MASSPTVLAWGYWGWGEVTEELVARFDAVESSRGFGPPLLVDVRGSAAPVAAGPRERRRGDGKGEDEARSA